MLLALSRVKSPLFYSKDTEPRRSKEKVQVRTYTGQPRPTNHGCVRAPFSLSQMHHCDHFLSCRAKVEQNYGSYIVLYLGVYTVPTLLG